MQTLFREEELSFVNEQPRLDKIVLYRIDDFVEGYDHRLKIGLEKLQRKIRGGFQTRNADTLA